MALSKTNNKAHKAGAKDEQNELVSSSLTAVACACVYMCAPVCVCFAACVFVAVAKQWTRLEAAALGSTRLGCALAMHSGTVSQSNCI